MQNNQNKSINVERIKAHVDQFGAMMPMYAKVSFLSAWKQVRC